MAFNYSPKITTNGLVLYLDAANTRSYPGTGTAWNDLSRSGNNGTLVNGPTFNSGNLGSIVFDGVDDYGNLGNPSSLSITNLTICVWAKSTKSGNQILVGKSYLSSYYLNFAPFVNNISFWTNNSELADYSTTGLGNGNWFFICATINSNNKAIYHNGILKTSGTGTPVAIDSNPVYIGNSPTNTAYLQGNISSVQIYNRALSATEILQNYNATKTRFGL